MKRLVITGNPFQLMLALFFREKVFDDKDITDILIFRSVIGHEVFAERLKELHLFRRIILLNEKAPKGNRIRKIRELFLVMCGHADKMSYIVDSELSGSDYDEVWYYNYCPWFYGIYDTVFNKENKKVRFVAFMESVLTYTFLRNDGMKPIVSFRSRLSDVGRRLFGKWSFQPFAGDIYIQFPEMADLNWNRVIHKLPLLSPADNTYKERIKQIFSISVLSDMPKYIFMASSLEFDGFGDGETNLILWVADIVGRDNLVVKLHPRDDRGIIEKAGIRTMEYSNVCWEALQLVNDLSDNVFLTVASASIVNTELFSDTNLKAYYLYPLISKITPIFKQYCNESVGKTINMAHKMGKISETRVIYNVDDLKNILIK